MSVTVHVSSKLAKRAKMTPPSIQKASNKFGYGYQKTDFKSVEKVEKKFLHKKLSA
jgi:hypothetical protein